jgi:hypothetical protein
VTENQIVMALITGAFSAGGAWFGTQFRIKRLEAKVDRLEIRTGGLMRRMIQLITAHNRNHEDCIDVNRIEGGGP